MSQYCMSVLCVGLHSLFCHFLWSEAIKNMAYLYILIHATCLSRLDYLVLTILAKLGELCKLHSFSVRVFRNDEICSQ